MHKTLALAPLLVALSTPNPVWACDTALLHLILRRGKKDAFEADVRTFSTELETLGKIERRMQPGDPTAQRKKVFEAWSALYEGHYLKPLGSNPGHWRRTFDRLSGLVRTLLQNQSEPDFEVRHQPIRDLQAEMAELFLPPPSEASFEARLTRARALFSAYQAAQDVPSDPKAPSRADTISIQDLQDALQALSPEEGPALKSFLALKQDLAAPADSSKNLRESFETFRTQALAQRWFRPPTQAPQADKESP